MSLTTGTTDFLEIFRFDYEYAEFDYGYDFLETFRFDYEYKFDYEYDFSETFRFDYGYYGYDFLETFKVDFGYELDYIRQHYEFNSHGVVLVVKSYSQSNLNVAQYLHLRGC